MKIFNRVFTVVALVAITSSCAKNLSSNTYTESSTAGIVYEGMIVSARPVTVKASDKLGAGGNGLGTLGGGLAGGIGGSQIGKGKGSALGAVGGAVAGAVIGNLLEDQLNTQNGMEYVVKINDENIGADGSKDVNLNHGKSSVKDKIVGSTKTGFKSRLISVIQGTDAPLAAGQKVYVIYNDDRPRVVAAF